MLLPHMSYCDGRKLLLVCQWPAKCVAGLAAAAVDLLADADISLRRLLAAAAAVLLLLLGFCCMTDGRMCKKRGTSCSLLLTPAYNHEVADAYLLVWAAVTCSAVCGAIALRLSLCCVFGSIAIPLSNVKYCTPHCDATGDHLLSPYMQLPNK
jgi:hypothetical protein